jgi:hypothetical protein
MPITKQFVHADDCKIVAADPDVEIPWNYEGDGLWRAECVCTTEYFREPITDKRVRVDPRDPSTAHHGGACEFADTTDPSLLRLVLKVADGANDGYWWVTCSACDFAWQVHHYAESVG